ncbi:enoyl-CoA hydratase [Psychrobacillus lasiicapitis]|uniref:Enoyl-CoA hydratase n=1 Tax=Psychrobacillus lasiicapitis TaxID=1636719 RepID=A0A544SV76_9BACI|nr:enoyl-CoA hydratase [Psychrobacillus lasiicapitis]TQR09119.1 enoyl-CoA hydratase [Psychrobacillus lasiicapitis]GGA47668.1 putative enoyl-CoA hydratase/isomerase YhaR [Psychrobacillus lasiicapitis]
MYNTLRLEKEGRVATLTLNRPEAMNSMNEIMMQELAVCLESLKEDTAIQVLLLKGEGRAFSAGGDIKAMLDTENPFNIEEAMEYVSRIALALYTLPQITIASVHGAAAGLGFSMVLGCDIVIAEENSKLAMNFIGIGLVPDGGGHFFLKERVGVPKAKQLIWSGQLLKGIEAKELGLVDEVASDGLGWATATSYAQKLLQSPIAAMIASKQILHASKIEELQSILEQEAITQTAMRKTADHIEGISAFVAKRKPAFTGQ